MTTQALFEFVGVTTTATDLDEASTVAITSARFYNLDSPKPRRRSMSNLSSTTPKIEGTTEPTMIPKVEQEIKTEQGRNDTEVKENVVSPQAKSGVLNLTKSEETVEVTTTEDTPWEECCDMNTLKDEDVIEWLKSLPDDRKLNIVRKLGYDNCTRPRRRCRSECYRRRSLTTPRPTRVIQPKQLPTTEKPSTTTPLIVEPTEKKKTLVPDNQTKKIPLEVKKSEEVADEELDKNRRKVPEKIQPSPKKIPDYTEPPPKKNTDEDDELLKRKSDEDEDPSKKKNKEGDDHPKKEAEIAEPSVKKGVSSAIVEEPTSTTTTTTSSTTTTTTFKPTTTTTTTEVSTARLMQPKVIATRKPFASGRRCIGRRKKKNGKKEEHQRE